MEIRDGADCFGAPALPYRFVPVRIVLPGKGGGRGMLAAGAT